MTDPSSPAPFGTLAWAQSRDGRTSRPERVREALASTGLVAPLLAGRVASRLGLPRRRPVRLDADLLRLPDSAIARAADEECRDTVSPMLHQHSVRTFLFGRMLAERDGLRPDVEVLYVASMLHDLTLGEVHRHHGPMACFAARGGLLAREWTAAHGWDDDRGRTVAEAICLHVNTRVDPAFGPEARLLQAGAAVDTIGLRLRHLDPDGIAEIVRRHPRLGLKGDGALTFAEEAHRHTRAHHLNRLGFSLLLRTSEFAS